MKGAIMFTYIIQNKIANVKFYFFICDKILLLSLNNNRRFSILTDEGELFNILAVGFLNQQVL